MEILERLENVNFEKGNGLVPTIVQDHKTKEVLMLAYMNKESLKKTLEGDTTWFYSRSRNEYVSYTNITLQTNSKVICAIVQQSLEHRKETK